MSSWEILVYFCIPLPLILLTILTLPFPKFVHKGTLALSKRLLFFPLAGGLQAVHVMLCVTALALGDQSYTAAKLRHEPRPIMQTDIMVFKAKIWRAERNFWIAVLCFVVWWMLSAYYRTLIKYLEAKDEITQLKTQRQPEPELSDRPIRPLDKKNA